MQKFLLEVATEGPSSEQMTVYAEGDDLVSAAQAWVDRYGVATTVTRAWMDAPVDGLDVPIEPVPLPAEEPPSETIDPEEILP